MADGNQFGQLTRAFLGGSNGSFGIEINKTYKQVKGIAVPIEVWSVAIGMSKYSVKVEDLRFVSYHYSFDDAYKAACRLEMDISSVLARHNHRLPDYVPTGRES